MEFLTAHCMTVGFVFEFTRLLVECVSQKEEDNAKGNDGCPPSQQEHDDYTNHSAQQRQPLTVEPEGRTPTCGYTHIHTHTHAYKQQCRHTLPIKQECLIYTSAEKLASLRSSQGTAKASLKCDPNPKSCAQPSALNPLMSPGKWVSVRGCRGCTISHFYALI